MQKTWEYRTVCLAGEEIADALNDAGREGFQILHVNHHFDGLDHRGGICFVLLGRESPVEEEPALIARGRYQEESYV
jgi:hypothetical protein